MAKTKRQYVIVRTYSAGVHAGELVSRKGMEVVLTKARRLWYWKGAFSLSELATRGTTKPEGCKFSCPIDITLTQAIEIIPATVEARKSIEAVQNAQG